MLLKELATTNHFKQRVSERVDDMEISLPFRLSEITELPENELFNRLKQFYVKHIKENIAKALSSEEEEFGAVIVADLYISYKGKQYKPIIIASDEKHLQGSTYYIPFERGLASTINLVRDNDELAIRRGVVQHFLRKYRIEVSDSKVAFHVLPQVKIVANIENLIKEKENQLPSIQNLEYIPRTDYRKNVIFKHQKYGEGTVLNTSNGVGGKGDMNGKLEWIDVDFKKPYLKDGKLTTVRRIVNVYALPGLQKIKRGETENIFESIRFDF